MLSTFPCRNSMLHYAVIGCVKALMNSPVSHSKTINFY